MRKGDGQIAMAHAPIQIIPGPLQQWGGGPAGARGGIHYNQTQAGRSVSASIVTLES